MFFKNIFWILLFSKIFFQKIFLKIFFLMIWSWLKFSWNFLKILKILPARSRPYNHRRYIEHTFFWRQKIDKIPLIFIKFHEFLWGLHEFNLGCRGEGMDVTSLTSIPSQSYLRSFTSIKSTKMVFYARGWRLSPVVSWLLRSTYCFFFPNRTGCPTQYGDATTQNSLP